MTASHIIIYGKTLAVTIQPILAGLASFAVTDVFTRNFWIAIIVSAICSVLVALIRVRPNHITASSDALAKMLERIDKQHHEQMTFLHERIVQQNKLLSLMTITKHNVLSEVQGLRFHLELRGKLLSERGVEFPEVTYKNLPELTKEEDRIRAEIVGIDLPEV